MKATLRWFALLVAIFMTAIGGLFLSSAFGKQRRASNAQAVAYRTATNVSSSSFTFSTPPALTHLPIPATSPCPLPPPQTCPSIKDQGIEPEIKVDLFGNIYVTAIHGYPGGVDLFKSIDKGNTFVYLGEPDGTQDKCVTGVTPCIGGAGGGDDSIDVSSGGYLYVSSLLPSTVTMSVSKDGCP